MVDDCDGDHDGDGGVEVDDDDDARARQRYAGDSYAEYVNDDKVSAEHL